MKNALSRDNVNENAGRIRCRAALLRDSIDSSILFGARLVSRLLFGARWIFYVAEPCAVCRASKRTLTLTTTYNFLSIVYLRDRLVTLRSRALFLRTCGAINARSRNTVRSTQDSRTSVGCCVIRRSKRSKNRVRLFFSTYQRKSLRSKRNHLRCSRLLKRKK